MPEPNHTLRAARERLDSPSTAPAITAPKPKALAKVEHAQLLAGSGHIAASGHEDEATRLGMEALRVLKEYGSERIVTKVTALHTTLPDSCERDELGECLNTLYGGNFP